MTQIKDGGPAFPFCGINATDEQHDGMTLRDYFAVHASAEDIIEHREVLRVLNVKNNGVGVLPDGWVAKARYMHADAMLKARGTQ